MKTRFEAKFILKFLLSLTLAFLVSKILVTKVTFEKSPVLRPNFQQFVHNLPTKITDQTKRLTSFLSYLPFLSHLSPKAPPPWIEPAVKPTIVAYKPPVYYPPTSTPKPTQPSEPTATPFIPTTTPTYGPSPTKGFTLSPTKGPYPTSTPTPSPYHSPTFSPTPFPTPTTFVSPSEKKAQLLNLINDERQKNGTASLSYHSALDSAAQGHADDMVQNDYFDHTGSDDSNPADRAQRAGYPSSAVGENIASGSTNPDQIFLMWMGSSGHRQNMLNPSWRSAGIGYNDGKCGRYHYCWVLLLGAK